MIQELGTESLKIRKYTLGQSKRMQKKVKSAIKQAEKVRRSTNCEGVKFSTHFTVAKDSF